MALQRRVAGSALVVAALALPGLAVATGAAATQTAVAAAVVEGRPVLLTLDPAVVPGRAAGQAIRLTAVEHEPAYTAWTGAVVGVPLSSVTIVRVRAGADEVYQGAVVSPAGVHTLTSTGDTGYRWTEAPPQRSAAGDDTAPLPRSTGERAVAAAMDTDTARAKGKVKIALLFAYTKRVKAEAGSRAALEAAAALVVSQTNEAFANSGLRVKVRYRGLVKAKGRESTDPVKDAFRISRPRDGHFDNLPKARRKKRADLVHLFTSGDPLTVCGGSVMPRTVREANPFASSSVSFYGCLPYLVATHEIGHNLGADHIEYPGVKRVSRIPYSYAYFNVPGNYFTAMGYYDPCEDVGIYTCVRLPYFSSPTNTFNGQPLGLNRATDNAKVIKKLAPLVARYVR